MPSNKILRLCCFGAPGYAENIPNIAGLKKFLFFLPTPLGLPLGKREGARVVIGGLSPPGADVPSLRLFIRVLNLKAQESNAAGLPK